MRLSLVIPAYNEGRRIGDTLRRVQTYLAGQPYDSEVLVVNDGSRDDTEAVVRAAHPPVRLITHAGNHGKGYAVKVGMLAAAGDYRVFYDADGSTPIDEIEKVWPRFEAGAAVVIGSRALPDSDIQVRQCWYRETMGRAYNRLLRLLQLTEFPDTQCGFKAFTAAACEAVFLLQTRDHFSFDAEILYIAWKLGLCIDQVPVRWWDSPGTRVHALFDSLRMFCDVLGVRLNAWAGRYG